MNRTAARQAGVWQAFAAGMLAESFVHTSSVLGSGKITDDGMRAEFENTHDDMMAACGIDMSDALKSFDAGRISMREARFAGSLLHCPAVVEDPPPLQLTGKPDRGLS
jgi:hypothetical protein